ncbi:GNAT family N-acetyltransferase [Flavobacterium jejuense]|uniref:GNAT family N-acetyltransferase n=1 Tax=Flavobacterium jejuense TaxID=1544455 RepID=A0ABX0IVL7_9FLAO|nr:GNAT family N-acetyltransferase [Flavobacterium jejuense]NHN27922.1 GNAT family N-acetyltransferase [Flavobacterium jejuense]
MNPSIISYQPEYKANFIALNTAWLEAYFVVEPYDKEVFENLETYILQPDGEIFFCLVNEEVAGTVAMQRVNDTTFELTKLAVDPKFQGLKLSHHLMKACITFAKSKKATKIMLLSNRKLETALNLYIKHGFIEVPMKENDYERANIQMELSL